MKIDPAKTIHNIRGVYGSAVHFARECGVNRRTLYMALNGERGVKDPTSASAAIIERLKTEGLIVYQEEGQ